MFYTQKYCLLYYVSNVILLKWRQGKDLPTEFINIKNIFWLSPVLTPANLSYKFIYFYFVLEIPHHHFICCFTSGFYWATELLFFYLLTAPLKQNCHMFLLDHIVFVTLCSKIAEGRIYPLYVSFAYDNLMPFL